MCVFLRKQREESEGERAGTVSAKGERESRWGKREGEEIRIN